MRLLIIVIRFWQRNKGINKGIKATRHKGIKEYSSDLRLQLYLLSAFCFLLSANIYRAKLFFKILMSYINKKSPG